MVNVKDFGAIGDGTTDDTAAFNAAIATGEDVYLPSGVYAVTSLNALTAGQAFFGTNENSVLVRTTSATAHVLTASSSNVLIHGVTFTSNVVRTAGAYVRVTGSAPNFRMRDVRMINPFIGIQIEEGGAIISLNRVWIQPVVAGGRGIKIGVGTGTGTFAIDLTGVVINTEHASGAIALEVSNVADLLLNACQLLDSSPNLLLNPGSGQAVTSVKCIGTYIDTSPTTCCSFTPTGTGKIEKVDFIGTWFQGGPANCCALDGGSGSTLIDGVNFVGCEAYNSSSGSGLAVLGNSRNVSWIGGKISGSFVGVYIDTSPGFDCVHVKDARIGPTSPYGGNVTGIVLTGNGGYNQIVGNDIRGNSTALTNSNPQQTNRVEANSGYNPFGMAGIPVGPSPFTYRAGPTPETVFINGGVVSLIELNTIPVFAASEKTIPLGPNEFVTVSYSSAPFMLTARH